MHDFHVILHDYHAFHESHAKIVFPPGAQITCSGNATTVPGCGNVIRRQVLAHGCHAPDYLMVVLVTLGFLHDYSNSHAIVMHFQK